MKDSLCKKEVKIRVYINEWKIYGLIIVNILFLINRGNNNIIQILNEICTLLVE